MNYFEFCKIKENKNLHLAFVFNKKFKKRDFRAKK